MQKSQVIFLSICSLLSTGISGFAQEKGDLGIVVSPLNPSRYGIEYRKPMGESFRLKVGINTEQYHYSLSDPKVLSVTDTTVFQSRNYSTSSQIGVRVGAERQLKTSIFSIGADLNFHYRKKYSMQWNEVQVLNDQGDWVEGMILGESEKQISQDHVNLGHQYEFVPGDFGYGHIRQHFFVPSVRTAINMDLPVTKMFTLHMSAAATLGLPIYMGASSEYDPKHFYEGNPPSTIEFDTNVNIGVRYNIGAFKKRKLQKMVAG